MKKQYIEPSMKTVFIGKTSIIETSLNQENGSFSINSVEDDDYGYTAW